MFGHLALIFAPFKTIFNEKSSDEKNHTNQNHPNAILTGFCTYAMIRQLPHIKVQVLLINKSDRAQ